MSKKQKVTNTQIQSNKKQPNKSIKLDKLKEFDSIKLIQKVLFKLNLTNKKMLKHVSIPCMALNFKEGKYSVITGMAKPTTKEMLLPQNFKNKDYRNLQIPKV